MRRIRFAIGAAALLIALPAAAPAQVAAAVEVGSHCEATGGAPNQTFIQISSEAGELPAEMPFSGVVTEWTINTGPFAISEEILNQALRIVRPTSVSGTTEYKTVGETPFEHIHEGINSFPSRVPVQAGDHVGLTGGTEEQAIYCETGSKENVMASTEGTAPLNTTHKYEINEKLQPAVAVKIEADLDGDGYGDETQDKCPLIPAPKGECPPVTVESFAAAGRKAATVVVTTSAKASVAISATVQIPKLKLGNRTKPARTLTLTAAPAAVEPGKLGQFTLPFPKPLQNALAALRPRGGLTLTVGANATDAFGRLTSAQTSVKLRGQRRVHRKR